MIWWWYDDDMMMRWLPGCLAVPFINFADGGSSGESPERARERLRSTEENGDTPSDGKGVCLSSLISHWYIPHAVVIWTYFVPWHTVCSTHVGRHNTTRLILLCIWYDRILGECRNVLIHFYVVGAIGQNHATDESGDGGSFPAHVQFDRALVRQPTRTKAVAEAETSWHFPEFRSSGRWFTTFYHCHFWRYGFWDLRYQWSGFFSTQTLMEMQPPRANRKIQIFKFPNLSGAMGMWRWGMLPLLGHAVLSTNQETRIWMMAPGFTVCNRDSSTASRVPRWFHIGRLHVSFRFVQPSCDAFWPMASRGEGSMNEMNGDAIASVWVRGLLRCFRNMEVWIQFGLLFLDKS